MADSVNPPMQKNQPVRFLCDEMLRGLAEWLRVAGYDTRVPDSGTGDTQVLEQARVERRYLVTRDRSLAQRARTQGPEVLLLTTQGLNANQEELSRRLSLDWLYRPFSRCKKCNTPLQPCHPDNEPPRQSPTPAIYQCPCCQQAFWEGSHVRHMRARLEALNRVGPSHVIES